MQQPTHMGSISNFSSIPRGHGRNILRLASSGSVFTALASCSLVRRGMALDTDRRSDGDILRDVKQRAATSEYILPVFGYQWESYRYYAHFFRSPCNVERARIARRQRNPKQDTRKAQQVVENATCTPAPSSAHNPPTVLRFATIALTWLWE